MHYALAFPEPSRSANRIEAGASITTRQRSLDRRGSAERIECTARERNRLPAECTARQRLSFPVAERKLHGSRSFNGYGMAAGAAIRSFNYLWPALTSFIPTFLLSSSNQLRFLRRLLPRVPQIRPAITLIHLDLLGFPWIQPVCSALCPLLNQLRSLCYPWFNSVSPNSPILLRFPGFPWISLD